MLRQFRLEVRVATAIAQMCLNLTPFHIPAFVLRA